MEGFESIIGVNFWTALFTFLNMLITFALLKKWLFKPVKKMIDDRQKEIDDMYADADASKRDAAALKEEYETHLAEAKVEREEMMRDAVQRANRRTEEILAEANAGAAAIREKAHSDIEQEKKKALNEVKNDISALSLEIASKVVEREIDEKQHKAFIQEFIDRIGEAS